MVGFGVSYKFISSFSVWSRGTNTFSKAHHCANTNVEAEQKVRREFKNYEKPYLNPYGQMVRWTFDYIEESYHTYISDKDDFTKPIEVFSKLKGRRLKKENIWNGD
jgi:hypothetical protein